MATHPKELVMLVAKDLTIKLMDKITYKIAPSAHKGEPPATPLVLANNVGDMFQVMATKVSQVLTDLG